MTVQDVLTSGKHFTRPELSALTELNDRAVRREIRALRRAGVPVIPLPGGGYKLAETEEEKSTLFRLYKGRALDMLRTVSLLKKSMSIDGQISVDEIMEAMNV